MHTQQDISMQVNRFTILLCSMFVILTQLDGGCCCCRACKMKAQQYWLAREKKELARWNSVAKLALKRAQRVVHYLHGHFHH